ncbi:MAG: GNAT family N-acetyltransferase [Eubacteriales bacterium]|nr:GNAT family N-acetyltransferase [Eubacteriales bacterium]
MRDFPFFTTEYGVASLILKEIPYRKTAFLHVRDVQPGGLEDHLNQCISFCRMAGAERVYATGHEGLTAWPLDCVTLEMRGPARPDRDKIACLFPVTEATAGQFRSVYNRLMAPVPHAATLENRDEQRIAEALGTYFIHRDGRLLGIGWMEDTKLLAVAAEQQGSGEILMHTLMSLVEGADIILEVSSTNERAIGLYEKMGFLKTKELTRWYRVL